MHDYFYILGVSRDARASEIRRACCRHARPPHPDIRDGDRDPDVPSGTPVSPLTLAAAGASTDAAVDFVDAATLVDGMLVSFFHRSSTPGR